MKYSHALSGVAVEGVAPPNGEGPLLHNVRCTASDLTIIVGYALPLAGLPLPTQIHN